MFPSLRVAALGFFVVALASGCGHHHGASDEALSPQGAKVAVARQPPTVDCHPVGYLVGQGSGREPRVQIEGAMNDLRNRAGYLGANYVQSDPPVIARRRTAAISGTAYRCTAEPTLR